MISLKKVLAFREDMYKQSTGIIEQKGHDYSRTQQDSGDTLFNLRVAEILGIVPMAERGILVRVADKLMRLISLMQPGVRAATEGESLRDTVADMHNYLDYALLLWEERVSTPPDIPQGGDVPQGGNMPPPWYQAKLAASLIGGPRRDV